MTIAGCPARALCVALVLLALPAPADARKRRPAAAEEMDAPAPAAAEPAPAPLPAPGPPPQTPSPGYEYYAPPPGPPPALAASRGLPVAETAEHLQALGLVGFASDDLNYGLGARVGYTLRVNVYVGGKFVYFSGTSQSSNVGGFVQELSASGYSVVGEAGYDFQVAPHLVIRPTAGLGSLQTRIEQCTDAMGGAECMSLHGGGTLLEMGGLLSFTAGALLLGGEVQMMVVRNNTAFFIGGHLGLQL